MYLVLLVSASTTTSLLVTNNTSISFYSMHVLSPKLTSSVKDQKLASPIHFQSVMAHLNLPAVGLLLIFLSFSCYNVGITVMAKPAS